MTRYAAVDCGTNSIRLLIADAVDGQVTELHRTMEIVRLGQGVDATGSLAPEAIARTREALERYVDMMAFEHVTTVRMVATSASRDADNRDEFFDMTAQLLGRIQPGARAEVITGEEEAELSFRGAVADLDAQRGPFCVVDLGGGSTEFVVGNEDGIRGELSTRMGCVRLTERILRSDPPTPEEIEEARDYVRGQLALVLDAVPVAQARTLVGCAGTFTTLSALAQGLETYDPAAIHGSELNFGALRVMTSQLISEGAATRALNPVIHEGRADVIGSGSVIVEEIMDFMGYHAGVESVIISEKDILDGIIDKLAAPIG